MAARRSLGEFRVSFTVRPLIWIRNGLLLVGASAFVLSPSHISQAADQVPPTAAEVARAEKVRLVHGELAPRMTKATPAEVQKVSEAIADECQKAGIDPLFILAIIESESNFDIEAVSRTGARGLMQVIPSTFRQVSDAKRMFDPVENVRAGIKYVRHLWDRGFGRKGGPESVLLAYNQGPARAIAVFQGVEPMPEEAAAYVPKVMSRYRTLLVRHGHKPKDAKKLFLAAR